MNLAEWRKRNKKTQRQVAEILGVHQITVARWETEKGKVPDPMLQREIFAMTNGDVTPNDWLIPQAVLRAVGK